MVSVYSCTRERTFNIRETEVESVRAFSECPCICCMKAANAPTVTCSWVSGLGRLVAAPSVSKRRKVRSFWWKVCMRACLFYFKTDILNFQCPRSHRATFSPWEYSFIFASWVSIGKSRDEFYAKPFNKPHFFILLSLWLSKSLGTFEESFFPCPSSMQDSVYN